MGWVDLDQLDDEEKKKKLEEKYKTIETHTYNKQD